MKRPDRPLRLSLVWSGETTPAGRFIICHMAVDSWSRGWHVVVLRWPSSKLERAILDKTIPRALMDLRLAAERNLAKLREHWRVFVLGADWRKRKAARYRARFERLEHRPRTLLEEEMLRQLGK